MTPLSDEDLIRALGGPLAVSRSLHLTVQAVANWRASAIPPRHHIRLWRMAKAAGLDWRPPHTAGLDLIETAHRSPPPPQHGEGDTRSQCFGHVGGLA